MRGKSTESEREKTELQIELRGWSSSMLAAFHDAAISRVKLSPLAVGRKESRNEI